MARCEDCVKPGGHFSVRQTETRKFEEIYTQSKTQIKRAEYNYGPDEYRYATFMMIYVVFFGSMVEVF